MNVTAENGNQPLEAPASAGLRFAAHIISVIFHPLFIPVYVTGFLLYWHPSVFAGFSDLQKLRIIGTVFLNLALLPAFTVFLLWRLKFSESIFLRTTKERIIPYAAMMFFSFWAWNVFNHLPYSPKIFTQFLLGTFITIIAGWMANIYYKVSMHGMALGGMLFYVILVAFSGEGSSGQYIAAATLITGLTCTARFLVSDHTGFEVYSGLFIGILCQVIAMYV